VVAGCWSAFCFGFLDPNLVIQLLEKCKRFLELIRDVVTQGEGIFDLIVQVSHECSLFYSVILLNISSIMLEFCAIGREVTIASFNHLQFPFCYCNSILVPKCCFQNSNQCWDVSHVDTMIQDVGLDLCERLTQKVSKGVA
jgi:hypothetical protein